MVPLLREADCVGPLPRLLATVAVEEAGRSSCWLLYLNKRLVDWRGADWVSAASDGSRAYLRIVVGP